MFHLTHTLPVKQFSVFALHLHVLGTDRSLLASFLLGSLLQTNQASDNRNTHWAVCVQEECRAAVLRHEALLRRRSEDMAAALPVCYHGAISTKECEDLLGKKNKDGAYLIRDSETIQGAKCLCV